MSEIFAISVSNRNNFNLEDLTNDDKISSIAIIFASLGDGKHEYIRNLTKDCKNTLIVNVEDFDQEFVNMFKDVPEDKLQETVNKAIGVENLTSQLYVIPSVKNLTPVVKLILENVDSNFIVGCSAGISRTGAIVHFLKDNGLKLNNKYNISFDENKYIYNLFNEIKNS